MVDTVCGYRFKRERESVKKEKLWNSLDLDKRMEWAEEINPNGTFFKSALCLGAPLQRYKYLFWLIICAILPHFPDIFWIFFSFSFFPVVNCWCYRLVSDIFSPLGLQCLAFCCCLLCVPHQLVGRNTNIMMHTASGIEVKSRQLNFKYQCDDGKHFAAPHHKMASPSEEK